MHRPKRDPEIEFDLVALGGCGQLVEQRRDGLDIGRAFRSAPAEVVYSLLRDSYDAARKANQHGPAVRAAEETVN